MVGLSHILLHVGLCGAIARQKPDTNVAMRVHVTYPVRPPQPDTQLDQVFHFTRGDDPATEVEFNVPPGMYRIQTEVPKYRCSATDYLEFLGDHNRDVTQSLHPAGAGPSPKPLMLLDGTAPTSFLYAKPTFVIFDSGVVCKGPVDTPLPSNVAVENDLDGYYVSVYPNAALAAQPSVVLALSVRTPTGLYHYVRLPVTLRTQGHTWPDNVQFNVSEDMLDELATEKPDTLLCPKLWETTVH